MKTLLLAIALALTFGCKTVYQAPEPGEIPLPPVQYSK